MADVTINDKHLVDIATGIRATAPLSATINLDCYPLIVNVGENDSSYNFDTKTWTAGTTNYHSKEYICKVDGAQSYLIKLAFNIVNYNHTVRVSENSTANNRVVYWVNESAAQDQKTLIGETSLYIDKPECRIGLTYLNSTGNKYGLIALIIPFGADGGVLQVGNTLMTVKNLPLQFPLKPREMAPALQAITQSRRVGGLIQKDFPIYLSSYMGTNDCYFIWPKHVPKLYWFWWGRKVYQFSLQGSWIPNCRPTGVNLFDNFYETGSTTQYSLFFVSASATNQYGSGTLVSGEFSKFPGFFKDGPNEDTCCKLQVHQSSGSGGMVNIVLSLDPIDQATIDELLKV